MNCNDIEIAVAYLFGVRRHWAIVPNVSFGLGLHECDLLIVRPTGFAVEVEIKISKSDLKKDAAKRHGHRSDKIKELYFAVPERLAADALEFAPERAGVIAVRPFTHYYHGAAEIIRPAQVNAKARPLDRGEMNTVARLAAMRIWGLKERIKKLRGVAVTA